MIVVGMTGGIASGKSLAASYLSDLGIPIIDTDEIARQVVAPDQPAWHRLCQEFGTEYLLPDGSLDRAALASHVFAHPEARLRLEAILHPAIFAEVDRQVDAIQHQTPPPLVVVVVVPLLFEVGAESRFDVTVLITAPCEVQLRRLQEYRGISAEEAQARLAAQLPVTEKIARADLVVENAESPEALRRRMSVLAAELRRRAEAS